MYPYLRQHAGRVAARVAAGQRRAVGHAEAAAGGLREAQAVAGVDEWLAAVAAEYGMPVHVLRIRRCRQREARDLAMYLVARNCRAGTSRSALAREMEMSLSGFVHASERGRRHLADPAQPLHARLQAVLEMVGSAVN